MNYNIYEEINEMRGKEAEFGNVELSYQYILKSLDKYKNYRHKKMVDIGTNLGTLPYLLYHRNGFDITGLECREDAINEGKIKYPEIADKLLAVGKRLSDIDDHSFDIVTMFDVIEHIPDVESYLKEDIFRILRPGGIFIFQTPNRRINPVFEMLRTKSFTAYKEYHCSLQTPKSLKYILTEGGFTEIKIEKYTIDSEFNRKKLKKYFGPLAGVIIKMFECVPLGIYPNLWGTAVKPNYS